MLTFTIRMDPSCKITLAFTHYNRFAFIVEAFAQVLDDPRIGEIVISDDCSTDDSYHRLQRQFKRSPKVKLFQNGKNLDCYFNKREAMERATSEWVILFDSDNVITPKYLDCIYALSTWDEWTAYCPEFAEPDFNYTSFAGHTVNRRNLHHFVRSKVFLTALNTCNYFVNRKHYLEVWDGSVNPHTSDSIFQNYNWMVKGGSIMIVPGLRYMHRIHAGSHYRENVHKTGTFARFMENQLRRLR